MDETTGEFTWARSDLVFAEAEIAREFPGATAREVARAVNYASRVTSPARGRVELTKASRRVLRNR